MPFQGTTQEVLFAQLNHHPDWTLPEGATVDSGTLYILRRLLEKDPQRRMQSAVETIQACRDQVYRLDRRECLRAEQHARLAAPEKGEILETGNTSLAHKTWTKIDRILPVSEMPAWVRWTGLGVIAAACAYVASCAMR